MESQQFKIENVQAKQSTAVAFIEANTIAANMHKLSQECVIPVFAKDNDTTISHTDFISTVHRAVGEFFSDEVVNYPAIRVSHPVKGRIPDAKYKKSSELLPHEETMYYERMMFCIELPNVEKTFDEEKLSLIVGGIRAYNLENLYAKKSPEKFKLFVGFKNSVCCNLSVWSDGVVLDLRASSLEEIAGRTNELLTNYDPSLLLRTFETWRTNWLTEAQFTEFIGKCKMYLHMPNELRTFHQKFLFGDYQLTQIVEGYYNDPIFGRRSDGSISQWNLYNLLTGSNKSSYIDKFLDRAVNATDVAINIFDYLPLT
jgi:hypothetical protein